MKKEQQIEDILTAIRKACPELMELGFGCEIRFTAKDSWHDPDSFGKVCEWSEVKGGLTGMKVWAGLNHYIDITKEQVTEIIGHEPHLEHLLRALNLPGDTRYETVVLQGSTLRIITPTRETETSIEEGVGINNEQYDTVTNDVWADITIDLTKSLRQNLENTDLREFIHSLLKV